MESLCSKYEEMMFDFIDGELTAEQADEFNKHITGCESCRAELERRKKTVKLISESAYEPKSSLTAAVTGSITQLKKNRKRFGWSSTIAACVVAVVILTNFFFMDMYHKNINKTDDRAVQENSETVNSKTKSKSLKFLRKTGINIVLLFLVVCWFFVVMEE
jgi:predicted anti-sigma-YlaC factor YlaD